MLKPEASFNISNLKESVTAVFKVLKPQIIQPSTTQREDYSWWVKGISEAARENYRYEQASSAITTDESNPPIVECIPWQQIEYGEDLLQKIQNRLQRGRLRTGHIRAR